MINRFQTLLSISTCAKIPGSETEADFNNDGQFPRKGCRGWGGKASAVETEAPRSDRPHHTPRNARDPDLHVRNRSIHICQQGDHRQRRQPACKRGVAVARKMTVGANHDSSAAVEVKEEEEETLGQLRDRVALATARALVLRPRAPFVHIKVEDTSSGEDTDGEGGGQGATGGEGDGEGEGEVEEEEEEGEDVEEQAEPRDLRAHAPGTSDKGLSEAVRHRRLAPGARTEPGAPRARLRVPGRVADSDIQGNDVPQPEEEEEAGIVPELAMRGGGDRSGSASRFKGVSLDMHANKWSAKYNGKHLGLHTTEEAAARAYNKYLKDGSVPEKQRAASSSQFKGVSWSKRDNTWKAECKRTHLGYHNTEEGAARAYNKYLEDGIDPVQHREAFTSQFTGVCWNASKNKWKAKCKGKDLGHHASEEAAACAYNKYLNDGIDPVQHREATNTSQFMGVIWNKGMNKWQAHCKGKYLGLYATEEAAAQAYNVEAERLGRPLNVIPPVGAAGAGAGAGPGAAGGAGPKRIAPKSPAAPTTSKKTKRASATTPAKPRPSKKMKL